MEGKEKPPHYDLKAATKDIMMKPSGTKFSRDKIVPQSDSRAGTASDRIIKKEVNRIATWNVRSLGVSGKLVNIKTEMKQLNIDILGMSEIKWKDEGDFWSNNYRAIYSQDKNSNTGVGIILTKEWGQRIKNYLLYNDRIMLIKLKTDKNDLFIIQTYIPTSGYKDEEVEEVYEQLEEIMDTVKKNDNLIILGDCNTVASEGQEGHAVGKYGLGVRNNRGQRLTDFCKEKELIITNTFCQQHPRRRNTWVKPHDTSRYQIHYIMVKKNHKIHVKQSKTYPGTDICSDHNVVVMKYKLQCKKKIYKPALKNPNWAVSKLK